MGPIADFVIELKNDLNIFIEDQDVDEGMRKDRLTSIFLRVIGSGLLLFSGASAAIASMIAFAAPIAAVPPLLVGGIAAILGHDLIKIGRNTSQVLNLIPDTLQGKNVLGNLYKQALRLYSNYGDNALPYCLNGTWVIGDIYRMIKCD